MEFGLNLSFATKRWLKPENLARMCAEDFKVKHIQFTLDLINPWWPVEQRNQIAENYKEAFEKHGLKIESVFGGVASYTFAQLLSPSKIQRDISLEFFKRSIDLTVALGSDVFGTPIGGMSNEDVTDEKRSHELYKAVQTALIELSAYGKSKGLKQIMIEPTPLMSEFLYTPQAAKKFIEEIDTRTEIPVRLLIDWGHALFNQIEGTKPDMLYWLQECSPYVAGIHLQQTDGLWDRHWDFTREGILNSELIKNTIKSAGLEDIVQYLEVVSIFEDTDDSVYDGVLKSMRYLHEVFDNT